MTIRRKALVLAAVAAVLPLGAAAQGTQPPPEVQEWIAEIQQIQAQVAPVQQQAMQEPELQREQEEVTDALRAAMLADDPTMEQKLERMDELMAEAQAAQAAQDQEKIVALTQEAQTLQPQIAEAQARALEKPEVDEKVAAFRASLHARMIEIDPATEPLLDRIEELDRQIREALEGSLSGA